MCAVPEQGPDALVGLLFNLGVDVSTRISAQSNWVNGMTFGQWTVTDSTLVKLGRSMSVCCTCSCGAAQMVQIYDLVKGRTKQCLACRPPNMGKLQHGMTRTKIHSTWKSIVQRTCNPNSRMYGVYGRAGVNLCERWKNFQSFYSDVGDIPFDGATVERLNRYEGYCPHNVVWADRRWQANNRSIVVLMDYAGFNLTYREWGEITGVHHYSIKALRNSQGLNMYEILTKLNVNLEESALQPEHVFDVVRRLRGRVAPIAVNKDKWDEQEIFKRLVVLPAQ